MMTKEVRICGECGREKPYYPPSPTPGYGPHSFNRDDYCMYCHKSTVTKIEIQKLEPKPSVKPQIVPHEPTTAGLTRKKPLNKSVPTDKYVSKYNTYAKNHPLEALKDLRIQLKMTDEQFTKWIFEEINKGVKKNPGIAKKEKKSAKLNRQRDALCRELKMTDKEFAKWIIDRVNEKDAKIPKQEAKLSKRERQLQRSAARILELRKKLREE